MTKPKPNYPTPPGSNHSDSSSELTENLPAGWLVKYSKSRNGKIYYYNTVTKLSTWKKPQPISDVQKSASLDATNKKPTQRRQKQEVEQSGKQLHCPKKLSGIGAPDSVPKKILNSAPIPGISMMTAPTKLPVKGQTATQQKKRVQDLGNVATAVRADESSNIGNSQDPRSAKAAKQEYSGGTSLGQDSLVKSLTKGFSFSWAPITVGTNESSKRKGNSQDPGLEKVAKQESSDSVSVSQESSAKALTKALSFSWASGAAISEKKNFKIFKTPIDSSNASQHLTPKKEAAQSGTVPSFRKINDKTPTSSVETTSPAVPAVANLENRLIRQGSQSQLKRKGGPDQESGTKKFKSDGNDASSSGTLVQEQTSCPSLSDSSTEENLHSQTYTQPVLPLETSNTNNSPLLKDSEFLNANSSHLSRENACLYPNNIDLHSHFPTKFIDFSTSIPSKEPPRTLQSTSYQASSSFSLRSQNPAENDSFHAAAQLLPDLDAWSWSPVFTSNSDLGSQECDIARQPEWQRSFENAEAEQDIEDMEVSEEGIIIQLEKQSALSETLTPAIPDSSSSAEEPKPDAHKSQIVLVIDTNVLISNLKFLRHILRYEFPDWGKPTLILPWVVVQELDYLKNRRDGYSTYQSLQNVPSTSFRAADAVRFIYSQLVNKNPHLIGQTPQQASQAAQETQIEQTIKGDCNDDKILLCSLQFQQKYPKSLVVLITRDINLINKAMIMGIKAATPETLWTLLDIPRPPFANLPDDVEPEMGKRGRKSAVEDQASNKSAPQTPQTVEVKKPKNAQQQSDTGTSPAASSKPNTGSSAVGNTGSSAGGNTGSSAGGNTGSPTVVGDRANSGSPVAGSKPKTGTSSKAGGKPPVGKVKPSVQNGNLTPKASNSTEPQTDAERALVLNKFDTVWRLIHDIKSGAALVLAAGQSHSNFAEAAKMIRVIRPLLSKLKDIFGRCLSLSPLVLLDNLSEFDVLCECLNSFFVQAHMTYSDPSRPLETLQLVKHFEERGNRITLSIGLEQLSSFTVDIDNLINLPC